jgi:hypothetical protein
VATIDRVWARSARMVGRRIGDEFVLVPLAGRGADIDHILNLNRVGTFIWEQLDGRTSGGQIVDRMTGRFEVDRSRAEADYLEFMSALREVEAVVPTGGDAD